MVFVRGEGKKGQVTLFIILAIVIVAAILLFVILKNNLSDAKLLDREVQPIYDSYLKCIENYLEEGTKILAYQGGYIDLPEFVPGSLYRPTSSQLDFFGQPVAYWYYISGSNVVDEQAPTKRNMEEELEKYIGDRMEFCDLESYISAGYTTYIGDGDISVRINDNSVEAILDNTFNIYSEDKVYNLNNHNVKINSKLGKFFNLAKNAFDYQQQTNFLEDYALDAMWSNLPVIGAEFSCEPLIFTDEELRETLTNSLSANIGSLKLKGNYYSLSSDLSKYYVVDTGLNYDENVNFMYSPNWPTKIDIDGERVVQPVGLQQGLELLGFCYAPYHLVYSFDFPVMMQFFDDELLFQFPMVVTIQNNEALNISKSSTRYSLNDEVCSNLNTFLKVYTYDYDLNPVEARLRVECMNSICEVGSTFINNGEALFEGEVPACINGKVIAIADGYLPTEYILESPNERVANIVLPKLHEIEVSLNTNEKTIVLFNGEKHSDVLSYPSQNRVRLAEGMYNISVIAYSDTNIRLTSIQEEICVDVPVTGVGGTLGLTQEKCYKIEDPVTDISMAVIGGGNSEGTYFTESELRNFDQLELTAELFDKPSSLEDLQQNYFLLEGAKLQWRFL